MNMLKRNGRNMDPCGTPLVMGSHSLFVLPIRTRWRRFLRYDMIRLQLSIDFDRHLGNAAADDPIF